MSETISLKAIIKIDGREYAKNGTRVDVNLIIGRKHQSVEENGWNEAQRAMRKRLTIWISVRVKLLSRLVENCFPVKVFQEETDVQSGTTQYVPVLDEGGNQLESRTALELKRELRDRLSILQVPEHRLDQLVNYFGKENVAELNRVLSVKFGKPLAFGETRRRQPKKLSKAFRKKTRALICLAK